MWLRAGFGFPRQLERTFQRDWTRLQLQSIDKMVLLGHSILIVPMMAQLNPLRDQAEAGYAALKALALLWGTLVKNCWLMWLLFNGSLETFLRVKRVALYACTILITPFMSSWFMLAGGRIWSCTPPSMPFWLLEINGVLVPAIVLHAHVFRLPLRAAVLVNTLGVLCFAAFNPQLCQQCNTLCPAGSVAKQRLAAWLRQRLGSGWATKLAGWAGWRGLLAGRPAWMADCTRVSTWWQLCALAAAMHLLCLRERRERLAWLRRQEARDEQHAAALSAAGRQLRHAAARPASRQVLQLFAGAVAAWLLVDVLL